MEQHRREVLKQELINYKTLTGISLSKVANSVGYNQNTLYRHFERADLPLHIISKYAKEVEVLKKKFPELNEGGNHSDSQAQVNEQFQNALMEAEMWKNKYISTLEKLNRLLEKVV